MLPQIRCAVCRKPVKHQGEQYIAGNLVIDVRCHGKWEMASIPLNKLHDPTFRFEEAFRSELPQIEI